MNSLTSRQRKIGYVVGIVCLLIPIIALGLPAGQKKGGLGGGGQLAKLRDRYDLGESTLGDVDPSSAAANLVLLGLRGPAASILKLEAIELQKTKNWAKASALHNTITLLQPHYIKVWEYEGWNLAYNVSQAWDALEDRFFWIKQGIKFLDKGRGRNMKSADLEFHAARFVGWKVGAADEWKYFRKYFRVDPDEEQFKGGPDPDINPEGLDNFLVSRERYTTANQKESVHGQGLMTREIFRQYPARVHIEYPARRQREGLFNDTTRLAWEDAYRSWTAEFGAEDFYATRPDNSKVRWYFESYFSNDPDVPDGFTSEIKSLARENFPDLCKDVPDDENINPALYQGFVAAIQRQKDITEAPIKLVNYRYWRMLGMVEKDAKMSEAHRFVYEGKQLFKEGKTSPRGEDGTEPSLAQQKLETGMRMLEDIFRKYPDLQDDSLIEESLMATQYWLHIHRLNNQEPPDKYPLYDIWLEHQVIHNQIKLKFNSETEMQR